MSLAETLCSTMPRGHKVDGSGTILMIEKVLDFDSLYSIPLKDRLLHILCRRYLAWEIQPLDRGRP
jgi:hypothetical protein